MAENDFSTGYAIGRDTQTNCGYGGGFGYGGDWLWAIILLALVGNGGFGFGGGFGGGFNALEMGRLATTNDVASGFNNSAVLSSLNDIKLGQQQAINYNNQGFSGLNTALLQGFHGVDNAVCTLGYQLSDCCCTTQRAIDSVKYENATNTCKIIEAINMGNQRLIDIYTNDKIESLRCENATLKSQISNDRQSMYITDTILERLSPCPKPAYLTCNPNAPYGLGYGVPTGCGCGCN